MRRGFEFLLLVTALLASSCGDHRPTARLTFRPAVWRVALGDRPDGQLKAEILVSFEQTVMSGAVLRVDQGFVEDGRRFFGREVRYRMPDLARDVLGTAMDVTAFAGETQWPVLPMSLDRGWFGVPFQQDLPAGQELRIQLGDPVLGRGGPRATTVPVILDLEVSLDEPGSSRPLGLVTLHVQNPEVDWVRVLGPSRVSPGEPVELRVLCMSGFRGPTSSSMVTEAVSRQVEVFHGGDWQVHDLQPVEQAEPFPAYRIQLPGLDAGVHRLRVRPIGTERTAGLSPPIVSAEGTDDRIFFGTLHNHTVLGGHASGTPRRALQYGRDVARLDFCGLTEHAESPRFDWPWLTDLVGEASEPGRFVAFAGLEWTHPEAGHRHLVYHDARQASPVAASPEPVAGVTAATDLTAFTRHTMDDRNVLCVVHHPTWRSPSVQVDYQLGEPDANPRQLLAEVYSWHGCALPTDHPFPLHGEGPSTLVPRPDLLRALEAGHRFTFIADSDQHLGRPGSLLGVRWPKSLRYSSLGLTAVRASALERDSIWQALESGSAYGTTGVRLLLEARRDQEGVLWLRVHATAPLARIQVFGGGSVIASQDYPEVTPDFGEPGAMHFVDATRGVWDVEERWSGTRDQTGPLVIEVIQQDQNRAWLSLLPGR